jgi:hypothetical protein
LSSRTNSNTTVRGQFKRVSRGVRSCSVDPNYDPSKEAILDAVPEEDVVEDGIRIAVRRLLGAEHVVLGVGGEGLGVGVVGAEGLDLGGQGLVPEELTDVGHVAHGQRPVRQGRGVGVHDGVQVVGPASIVARVDGGELDDAVAVRLLDAAEGGVIQVACVRTVAVVAGLDAAVDTRGVTVPDIEPSPDTNVLEISDCFVSSEFWGMFPRL